MTEVLSVFLMPFFYRAFLVLLLSGAAFPVLGTFILNLELISARFAVMHAALLGAAVALILRADPLWVAMAASVLAGIAIAVISWRGRVSAGGSLGLIMTLCLGLSFIIFYKSNVQAVAAFNLFWGNVLALSSFDCVLSIIVSAGIFLFLICAYKEIHIVLFDRELARALGVRSKLIYGGIMLSVCLGIAVAMRITGALLVDALTILPALAARQTGKTFKQLLVLGSVLGIVMNMCGFTFAFLFDLPVSPAIIVTGALIDFGLKTIVTIKQNQKKKGIGLNNE
jgi:zinc transport system permease protein